MVTLPAEIKGLRDKGEYRGKVAALEEKILELEPVEMVTNHYFAHGTYTRELIIPKGTLVTGKIHRYSCTNIITKGKILAVSDEGEYEIEAPHVFVSGSDVKKACYALEDTIWINVHPWDGKMDLEQIEQELIVPPTKAIEQKESLCLGQ